MNKTVSIIIPVYNTPVSYFDALLASINAQSYQDLEVVIVDDGSEIKNTTKYVSIAQHLSCPYIYRYAKKRGVSAARNLGLRHSTGDYIAFIDSDDTIEPDYIETLLTKIVTTDSDIVFSNIKKYNNQDILSKDYEIWHPDIRLEQSDNIKALICNSYMFTPKGAIIKRELAQKLTFNENLTIGEDTLYIYDALKNTHHISYVDTTSYNYRGNTASVMHGNGKAYFSKYLQNCSQLCDALSHGNCINNNNLTKQLFTIGIYNAASRGTLGADKITYKDFKQECERYADTITDPRELLAKRPDNYFIKRHTLKHISKRHLTYSFFIINLKSSVKQIIERF